MNGSKEEQGLKKKQGRRMCEKGEATKEQVCEEEATTKEEVTRMDESLFLFIEKR